MVYAIFLHWKVADQSPTASSYAALDWDLSRQIILQKTVTRALTTHHEYLLYLMFLTGRCQIYSQLASSCWWIPGFFQRLKGPESSDNTTSVFIYCSQLKLVLSFELLTSPIWSWKENLITLAFVVPLQPDRLQYHNGRAL